MTKDWTASFLDELQKVAARLTKGEERTQAAQFAGLGALTIPSMELAKTKMQTGKWIPSGVKGTTPLRRLGRFLPGSVATGLFWGGALPAVQHLLARRNLEKADARREAQSQMKELGAKGVASAVAKPLALPGIASALKQASQGGQDLRLPVMGGTKFTTKDSKGLAGKRQQQSLADVGPLPTFGTNVTLDDVVAAPKPKWASEGDPMDHVATDPLVQYLRKQASSHRLGDDSSKEQPPLTGLTTAGGQLKDNEPDMPTNKSEKETTSEDPGPTKEMEDKVLSNIHATTEQQVDNKGAITSKHTEKDHAYDPGVVDRVLGL